MCVYVYGICWTLCSDYGSGKPSSLLLLCHGLDGGDRSVRHLPAGLRVRIWEGLHRHVQRVCSGRVLATRLTRVFQVPGWEVLDIAGLRHLFHVPGWGVLDIRLRHVLPVCSGRGVDGRLRRVFQVCCGQTHSSGKRVVRWRLRWRLLSFACNCRHLFRWQWQLPKQRALLVVHRGTRRRG